MDLEILRWRTKDFRACFQQQQGSRTSATNVTYPRDFRRSRVESGKWEWLFVFYHYHLPRSTTKYSSLHVCTYSELSSYTSIWQQAFVSSVLCIHLSVVLSMSQLLSKSVLKMDKYISRVYGGIHLILGKFHGNGAEALRLYVKRCPLNVGFWTHARFTRLSVARVRPVLFAFLQYTAHTETRRSESPNRTFGAHDSMWGSPSTVVPHKLQEIQALNPLVCRPGQECCQWFLRQCGENLLFSRPTPEGFTRSNPLNSHNRHIWVEINPHSIQFSAGINNSFQLTTGLLLWENLS